jgi:hypothetical protein
MLVTIFKLKITLKNGLGSGTLTEQEGQVTGYESPT